MRKEVILSVLILLLISIIAGSASAHIPFMSMNNGRIENAVQIEEPERSWAIYEEIEKEEWANYFYTELREGDRLYVSLFTPEGEYMVPQLIIMGPDPTWSDTVPEGIDHPSGLGAVHLSSGTMGEAEFEPFTPSVLQQGVEFDEEMRVAGTYYIVVFNLTAVGKVGLTIGYQESWGPLEWVKIGVDVVRIHVWEGQDFFMIMLPFLLTVGLGGSSVALIRIRTGKGPERPVQIMAALAALLFTGTSMNLLYQLMRGISALGFVPSMLATLVIILIPLGMSLYLFRFSSRRVVRFAIEHRLILALMGLLGLAFWSGFFLGPILLLAGAIMPGKLAEG